MPTLTCCSAQSPGKLILSGEHAVVYGQPALALAVRRHVLATVSETDAAAVELALPGASVVHWSPAAVAGLMATLDERHERYLAGDLPAAEVVRTPPELVAYAIALAWQQCGAAPAPMRLALTSQVPPGCGLGSSAAIGLATLAAVAGAHGLAPSPATLTELSLHVERLQHGRPSGVDSAVCAHGGAWHYTRQERHPRAWPLPPLLLVHTGRPAASTGECVATVAARWRNDHALWAEFGVVTAAMDAALAAADQDGLRAAVRANHRLLLRLGVVPAPVAALVSALERAGGAAKLCGAGCIRGPGGGMLWALADEELLARVLPTDYSCSKVEGDWHGTRVVAGISPR